MTDKAKGRKKAQLPAKMTQKNETPETAAGWSTKGMSEADAAEAEAIRGRVENRPRRPKLVLSDGGEECEGRKLVVGEGDDAKKTLHAMRLYEAMGSRSNEFIDHMLHRLSEVVRTTGDDERDTAALSAAMAVIAAVNPRDELESTMALQMIAANEAALLFLKKARTADYMEHAVGYSNMGNKAMRSFALHAETLAKLRRGGEQVVRHVHVSDGGQAVIANTVNTTGGRG